MNKSLVLLLCLALAAVSVHADEFEWSDIGLRIGIDAENSVNVNSYELIATLESPWEWSLNDALEIELGFEFGLGALDGEGETGFLAHAGPAIEFDFGDLPFELILSSGPALLSKHKFDSIDLGGSFEFMSAVGFDYDAGDRWTLGYRYLHLSNAGLHSNNPGMNFHALSVFYEF